jgi:enoyl-CoA hydratase/carnithine racemase
MTGTDLLITRQDGTLIVTFNRPERRNALTWQMYGGVQAALERARTDDAIRVLVFRGAGSQAFVSGTDISQFLAFESGEDGVSYERQTTALLTSIQGASVPTIAAINGYCVGAGLAIAAACDLRIASSSSRFGVPIARTLGNCLSVPTHALLVHHLGPSRVLDLVLRARMLTAEEALAAGFLNELVADGDVDDAVNRAAKIVASHAPLTMWATREAVRRVLRIASLDEGDDIVERVYGSADFRRGARAFLGKEVVQWTGR